MTPKKRNKVNRRLPERWRVLHMKALFVTSVLAIGILSGCASMGQTEAQRKAQRKATADAQYERVMAQYAIDHEIAKKQQAEAQRKAQRKATADAQYERVMAQYAIDHEIAKKQQAEEEAARKERAAIIKAKKEAKRARLLKTVADPKTSVIELCTIYNQQGNKALADEELKKRKAFTAKEWDLIKREKIQIGMKSTALLCSWGVPKDVNVTQTRWGRHTQWVYGQGNYVYTDDGIVSSWQQ